MMRIKNADLWCLAVIASVVLLALARYSAIPDPMPTRYNLVTGNVRTYMPRFWGVLIFAAMPVIPYTLLKILPRISPRGFRMDSFQGVVDTLMLALTVCLGGTTAAVLLVASGIGTPSDSMVPAVLLLVGGTLAVFGNSLGKVRKNFFIGIRTPWTLASDEVWVRTHRLGARLLVIGGLVLISVALTGVRPPIALIVVVAVAAGLTPVVYSLVLYHRLGGFRQSDRREPVE